MLEMPHSAGLAALGSGVMGGIVAISEPQYALVGTMVIGAATLGAALVASRRTGKGSREIAEIAKTLEVVVARQHDQAKRLDSNQELVIRSAEQVNAITGQILALSEALDEFRERKEHS